MQRSCSWRNTAVVVCIEVGRCVGPMTHRQSPREARAESHPKPATSFKNHLDGRTPSTSGAASWLLPAVGYVISTLESCTYYSCSSKTYGRPQRSHSLPRLRALLHPKPATCSFLVPFLAPACEWSGATVGTGKTSLRLQGSHPISFFADAPSGLGWALSVAGLGWHRPGTAAGEATFIR